MESLFWGCSGFPLPGSDFIARDRRFPGIGVLFGLDPNILLVQSDVETTPLPAALPLFAGGLGVMGLIVRRRKRSAS